MVLLIERTHPVKMPAKRLFEECSHQNVKNSLKFKPSNTNSIRTFPMHCGGPSAPETERASPGFSGGKDMEISKPFSVRTFLMHCDGPSAPETERASTGFSSGVKDREISKAFSVRTFPMHCGGPFASETERASPGFSGAAAISAKPLRVVASSEVNNEEYMKPNGANDDGKVESIRGKLNLKNEKFQSAVASRKLDWDVLLPKRDGFSDLKTLPQLLPVATDHQMSKIPNSATAPREIALDWDALLPDTRDELSNLKTSVWPLECASEYENTKISKRAPTLFRESPDSGEAHVSLSKAVPLANGRCNFETKPLKVKAETNEDDDCVIIEEKSNNVWQGNCAKYQLVSSTVTQTNSGQHVQGQTSRRRDNEGEEDDEEVYILSASEWMTLLQSGFNLHNKREKDSRVEFSVGKNGTLSQIYWVEDFTEESVKETEAKNLKNINFIPYDAANESLKENRAEFSVGQIGKRSEIYWVEDFTEEIVDEAKDFKIPYAAANKSEKQYRAEVSVGKTGKRSEIYWVEESPEESVKETEAKYLKNVNIVPYDAATDNVSRNNVRKARGLYNELFESLLHEYKEELKGGKITKQMHVKAAMLLKKKQRWVNAEPSFGHVPGVEIGDQFQYRAELALVGLHRELNAGINYVSIDGKDYAISVVDAGRYENKVKSPNILVYSGQGGNPKIQPNNSEDQKLEGGNLALKNSMDAKLPVRVIRKTLLASDATSRKMYIYDGLYAVSRFWPERSDHGKLALMFELVRLSGQPDCNPLTISKPRRSMENSIHGKFLGRYDASQGEEKIPIMVVNEVNNEKPAPFTYITKIRYPKWYELSITGGCDCIGGCSDSVNCPCSVKNNGELPFNEEGAIVKAKRMVYQCGPNCKCPPSCQNRVGQHGPRFPLEVFRTKSTGWGVRSPVEIPSGSFICEYIGELLEDNEADQRTDDEYLFDLDDGDGFTIDAAQYGNVGRFINHSCSPNLYAQNVLYDHNDKRLPHIMFFATKNIPALQELAYDYNYKLDRVCDANGNIKKKKCFCGSRKCAGRMY